MVVVLMEGVPESLFLQFPKLKETGRVIHVSESKKPETNNKHRLTYQRTDRLTYTRRQVSKEDHHEGIQQHKKDLK